jgi:DNA-binding NarL/FixJ family response regulator
MKISIVEDDVLLRENLKLLLSGESGISVVSAYGSAEEALKGIKKARPNILLADIGLPGMSGI